DASLLLSKLSGKTHKVVTGVCLLSQEKIVSFEDTTEVTFKILTEQEIDFYVKEYQPYDKAGAYGIQEWIGLIGVTNIKGSYFNVVGLPVHKVYEALISF
ncbi:MAG: Maf family protein, partial [Cyclobacteriaceae bacterium]